MQTRPIPMLKDLVLIGGGHSHALVLRMWAMKPLPGVRLTLINPGPVAPYTGMLPGLIAGHYAREALLIDLVRLARFAGARLVMDRATGLDLGTREVHLADRPPIAFDLASLDVGITSDLPDLPGFAAHSTAAKPLGDYAARWQDFVARALPRPRLVIIGAGVGGMELALASAHRLRAAGAQPQVTLVGKDAEALPGVAASTRRHLLGQAARLGVEILLNAEPATAEPEAVVLTDGRRLASDFTLTVAGARPQPWLAATGLALTDGFVTVNDRLQSADPLIFAAGDCAHLAHAPRPKAGVYAVRAAPVLFHNLRASLTGTAPQRFQPQDDYLKLISTGGKSAVADKFGITLSGPWLWRLKDRIDRRFMAMFEDFPAMAAPALPSPAVIGLAEAMAAKPLCGGCGAKIGPQGLAAAVAGLPAPRRADVIAGPGDDAAQLSHGDQVQVITTDHLRAFTDDPRLMTRIAATHALGDIWAMAAEPQAALAQITLPQLSEPLQARTLTEIMQAAAEVFSEAGADIVGGHSSLGPELTIGFTVTGLARRPLTKAGARPGDLAILTKPLGTGTIMAAEMAMARLPGLMLSEAVAAAYVSMTRSLGPGARALAPRAHAMTDVTGFGLAGHLMEMLDASGVAATLDLSALPLLPGAEALAAAGYTSSLAPANRAALIGRISAPDTPRTALLYDPQTGGGLLAAVPPAEMPDLLAAMAATGESVHVIGAFTEGEPRITVTN